MTKVELFEQIRKDHFIQGKSIRQISRERSIHRRQVRQALSNAIPPTRADYNRHCQVLTPAMKHIIDQWVIADQSAPKKQRHTGSRVYQQLREEHGFTGAEVTARQYFYQQRREQGRPNQVFVPQIHHAGEEAEVDWYEAYADFPDGCKKVSIFMMRASHSGVEFHRSFERQNQQAFLQGHVEAFAYFGGSFQRIRYDNLTSAVKKVLKGRKRIETEQFVALRSHYLFETFFCQPGINGAHEKGGVEGGVGRFRLAHLVPVPQVTDIRPVKLIVAQ